jgi:hypothetical protein
MILDWRTPPAAQNPHVSPLRSRLLGSNFRRSSLDLKTKVVTIDGANVRQTIGGASVKS